MKIYSLFLVVLGWQAAMAQPKLLPVSISLADENGLAGHFNTNRIQFLSAVAVPAIKGICVVYEKIDTLSFKHPFFKQENEQARDYILQGLALYEKQAGGYRLKFANDQALFCASCNNMHGYNVSARKDTFSVSVTWGPPSFSSIDTYRFVYNKTSNRWPLTATYVSGENDMQEERHIYKEYKPGAMIFLDNYVAEDLGSGSSDHNVSRSISLYYRAGQYKSLLDSLYKIPQNQFGFLSKIFTASDAESFIEKTITSKEVEDANNIGYFLEQVNMLSAAEVFLKKVIEAFPKEK